MMFYWPQNSTLFYSGAPPKLIAASERIAGRDEKRAHNNYAQQIHDKIAE